MNLITRQKQGQGIYKLSELYNIVPCPLVWGWHYSFSLPYNGPDKIDLYMPNEHQLMAKKQWLPWPIKVTMRWSLLTENEKQY